MRFQPALSDFEINGCYGLVVSVATMYKSGITLPESTTTTTTRHHRNGSAAKKHLWADLPAENRSWRVVAGHTMAEITSWVNKRVEKSQPVHLEMKWPAHSENDNVDTQTSNNKHTWRRSKSIPRGKPASAPSYWRWYVHQAQGWCPVYLQVHRLGGWSVHVQMHLRDDEKSNEFDLYWPGDFVSTKAVSNMSKSLLNGIGRVTHQIALWQSVETTVQRWWLGKATKMMAEWLQIEIECEDYWEPYLPKELTGMFTKWLPN